MKIIFIRSVATAMAVLFCLYLSAQTAPFTRVYSDVSAHTQGYAVQRTLDGNFLIAGKLNYFPMAMKIDSLGYVLWIRQASGDMYGHFQALSPTHDSCYVFAGSGDASFDIILMKFTLSGDTIFSKRYTLNQPGHIHSVQQTFDHGFILCGHLEYTTLLTHRIFLMKVDSQGNIEWNKSTTAGGAFDMAYSARQTADSGFIVAGETGIPTPYHREATLLKLDAEGNILWSKRTQSPPTISRFSSDVQITDSGYVWMVFSSEGFLELHRTDTLGNPLAGIKYNCMLPSQMYGLPMPKLRRSAAGGYFMITAGYGYGDQLIRFDNDLNVTWTTNLMVITQDVVENPDSGFLVLGNGPIMGVILASTLNEQIGAIRTDKDGLTVNCSWTSWVFSSPSTVSTVNLPLLSSSVAAAGKYPAALAHYNLFISDDCVAVTGGVEDELPDKSSIHLQPNPSHGVVHIELSGAIREGLHELDVYDTYGRQVYHDSNLDGARITADLRMLPTGIYLCRVSSDGGPSATGKVCILR